MKVYQTIVTLEDEKLDIKLKHLCNTVNDNADKIVDMYCKMYDIDKDEIIVVNDDITDEDMVKAVNDSIDDLVHLLENEDDETILSELGYSDSEIEEILNK